MKHAKAKTYISIALMVVLGPLANIFFKAGMKNAGAAHLGSLAALAVYLLHVFSTPAIWLGIIARVSFTIIYMLLLSWADYTYVTPVTAISYGVVAMMGFFLLGESISLTRWLGVLIICLGVAVVGSTPVRTTEVTLDISEPEDIFDSESIEPVLETSSRT